MSEASSVRHRADWYPDPAGRFELRYHNGTGWTSDVSSNGRRYVDNLGVAPTPSPNQPAPADGKRSGKGAAVAALVLGICGICTAWLPYVFVVGAVCAVLAVVFATTALRRLGPEETRRGAAVAGLITGGVGCVVAIGGFFFTLATASAFDEYRNPGPVDASIEACDGDGSFWNARGAVTNLDDSPQDLTVRVVFERPGTDNALAASTVTLDDVGPGEAREFSVMRRLDVDAADCELLWVRGPQPFGIAVD